MEPKSARIWGFGEPGSRIEINYDDNINVQSFVGGKYLIKNKSLVPNYVKPVDGVWEAVLLPHAEGGPVQFEIIHVSKKFVTFKN